MTRGRGVHLKSSFNEIVINTRFTCLERLTEPAFASLIDGIVQDAGSDVPFDTREDSVRTIEAGCLRRQRRGSSQSAQAWKSWFKRPPAWSGSGRVRRLRGHEHAVSCLADRLSGYPRSRSS